MTNKDKLYLHKEISYVKSCLRIGAYGFLPFSLPIAAALLIVAEIFGLMEEMVL